MSEAIILNIDTSTEYASICLSENGACLNLLSNAAQKDHAAWLHPAIMELLAQTGKHLHELKAVGVTIGPGSFTGIRVGLATAKGLCYALDVPLIGVNTLEVMASAASGEEVDCLCPMIDARRMEVYTALYDKKLIPLLPPTAMILDAGSFSELLSGKTVCFFGSGKNKFEKILTHPRALFRDLNFDASHLSPITYNNFSASRFSSLLYTEPLYLKDNYLPSS